MNIESKKNTNRKIALTAAFGALTILFAFTRLGMIPWFSGASITILHVPVILGTILGGIWVGSGIGLIFGLSSLILAATQATSALDPYFVNPLISVLPRLLIAPAVFFTYKGLAKGKKSWFKTVLTGAVSAFVGTLTNSFFVLGALVIAKVLSVEIMFTVIVSNSLLEAGAAMVITVSVLLILDNSKNYIEKKRSKLSSVRDED